MDYGRWISRMRILCVFRLSEVEGNKEEKEEGFEKKKG
jgi:hypothetical protein